MLLGLPNEAGLLLEQDRDVHQSYRAPDLCAPSISAQAYTCCFFTFSFWVASEARLSCIFRLKEVSEAGL